MTDEPPSARLSPQQKACLRLVYARRNGGQIAQELGISKSTVESHLAQARKLLGTSTSVEAAIIFADYEGSAASRVSTTYPAPVVTPTEMERSNAQASGPPWWRPLVPFKLQGQIDNELTIIQRLFWVVAIAFIGAGSFGFLVVALVVLGRLYAR